MFHKFFIVWLLLTKTTVLWASYSTFVHIKANISEDTRSKIVSSIKTLPQFKIHTDKKILKILKDHSFNIFRSKLSTHLVKKLQQKKINLLLLIGIKKLKEGKFTFACRMIFVERKKEKRLYIKRESLSTILSQFSSFLNYKSRQTWGIAFFIGTAALIIFIFCYSLYTLISRGRISVFPNLIQVILFCLLYFQIYHTFGTHHYQFAHSPGWYDWPQFTLAHILRAADILDFIEEYNINLQNLKHNSLLSGTTIIIMHWMVDIFLVAWLVSRFKAVKNLGSQLIVWVEKVLWVIVNIFIILYIASAFVQKWQPMDILLLWGLDNFFRVLDVGDTFQVLGLKLHHVDKTLWNSTLAIFFRCISSLYIAQYINKIRLLHLKGAGLTIDNLLENLSSKDTAVSQAATEALIKLGKNSNDVIYDLCKTLKNKGEMRYTTAQILAQIGVQAQKATPYLIKVLEDKDGKMRELSCYALGKMGAQKANPHLIKTLKDPLPQVRLKAAQALGSITIEKSIVPLIKTLTDIDQEVRKMALQALEKIDPLWHQKEMAKSATSDLLRSYTSKDPLVQEQALHFLHQIFPLWYKSDMAKKAIPYFLKAVQNKNIEINKAGQKALKLIGSHCKEINFYLTQALAQGKDVEKLRKVAFVFGKIGPNAREIVPQLISILHLRKQKKVEAEAVQVVIEILGKMGKHAEEAIVAISQALLDPYDKVRQTAWEALEKIHPLWFKSIEKEMPTFIIALTDRDSQIRDMAKKILEKIDSNWYKRQMAANAVEQLSKALSNWYPDTRREAAKILGQMGPLSYKAVPYLIKMLKGKDPFFRKQAAITLGEIGPGAKKATAHLKKSLKDKNFSVRQAATAALAKIEVIA